jgi:hypothetical protein
MHLHCRVGADDSDADWHNIGGHNIERSQYNGRNDCRNDVNTCDDTSASSCRNAKTDQDR